MDFIRVAYKENKDGTREFYPSLQATESQDLVIRGGQFVAIWDADAGLYSRRQSHVPDIIDRAFSKEVGEILRPGDTVMKMRVFENQLFNKLISLMRNIGDMGPELDQRIVFADEELKKEYAATFRMGYSLSDAPHPAWNKIVSTLYAPDERNKIEYAIGSILSGASITMQKFYVLFGPPGSGKSTILNIIEMLFEGHTATFIAADLGKADKQFALEPFSKNPLVGVDQDADLSRIELNVNLNLITSHDRVLINAKGKNLYGIIPRTCLFIGTNEPVKISNRKSGLFRRLVDIQPTGDLLEEEHYHQLMEQVKFELGSIARHCVNVFNKYGPTFLSSYRSHDMMYRTNDIFNFVEDNRLILAQGCTLKQAHKLFTEWCEETDTRNVYKQYQFRDLLSDYFDEFHDQLMVDGTRHRSYFTGLKILEKFSWKGLVPEPTKNWLELTETKSLLDSYLAEEVAQYASSAGTPKLPWDVVTTQLSALDTTMEHYTKVPTQHIIIDFDLKDEHDNKSLERNLAAASRWPATYAETSRGGGGIHLHYEYDGDVERLADGAPDGSYEIKKVLGGSALRRRVSLCNNLSVAHISSGLPLKEEKAVLSPKQIGSEKGLREQILKCITKQYHMHTKPNMDFLAKILDDAVKQGMAYDVTDMYDDILSFAMSSSNSRDACLQILLKLPLKSELAEYELVSGDDKPIQIYDLEVYPNLFAIGWMYDRDDAEVVKLLNPSTAEVEAFLEMGRREGYNIRGYDEHILHLASMGATNMELYKKSQEIISNQKGATFRAAYNTGYADIFDIIVEKHTLKWWQIKLGLPHMEMDLPWDQPVPDDRVADVMEYMGNDVKSTRALKHHRMADYKARQILAELTGMQMINTNRQLTERLIFGDIPWDSKPDLVYTDLSEMFPGYAFNQFAPAKDKSTYKGISVGEGGWVKSKPGMYENVGLLDVASMHPTSIIQLNLFGQYTPKFEELLEIRLGIKKANGLYKEERFDEAQAELQMVGEMFNGRLAQYVSDITQAKMLSDALKIVVNSVYGLTAASFPNKFKDERNIDNIVAKRGALFMVDLVEYAEQEGFDIVHVKTDSVKIPNITPEIVKKVTAFGAKYGYVFEAEAIYNRFCLVNDAVYVCREDEKWSATGAQFQHPVVFKTLFSKAEFEAKDYVETKQVQKGAMYLRTEETGYQQFVGRFGAFVPVLGGRQLLRIDGEKEAAVTGTKGYLWEIDEVALNREMDVDMDYFQGLVTAAVQQIGKYGDVVEFTRP